MIYKCKNCGGNILYNPDKNAMVCPQCDSEESQDVIPGQMNAEEGYTCTMCGAALPVGDHTSSVKCGHCGTYVILDNMIEGEKQPKLVLPFKISKEKAVDLLRQEFKSRYFTPDDFLSKKTMEDFQGRYVPFWFYDRLGKYVYDAIGVKIRKWMSNDMEYTETSRYAVHRDLEIQFEKIPVDASLEMPDNIMDLMEPYGYQDLIDFDAKYMSGFLGEVYNETWDALEPRADQKSNESSEFWLRQSLTGYMALEAPRSSLSYENKANHFGLMPVWVYTYRYNGQNYMFYVNAQTGKIIGKTPVSTKKALVYCATLFTSITIIGQLLVSILGVF